MKVEILQNHKNDLHDELDYDLFLSLFVQDQPLLSSIILRCLDKEEAVSHYEQLAKLEQKFQPEKIDTICAKSAALPALDHLLNSFAKGELEQYHLFELGNFLQNDRILSLLEKLFPLDTRARKDLDQILQILEKYTEKSFSTMRINRAIEEIQIALA